MSAFALRGVGWFALCLSVLPAHAWDAQALKDIALYPERRAQAQVVSLNESRIAAELSARILSLPVEPGMNLPRGALLARLDCTDYDLATERAQAAVAAAEARARLAALQYERAGKLAADHFVSPDALDARAAELESARAEAAVNAATLKTARAQQKKCELRAPFPAVVIERLGQEGEMASPGAPLLSLLDTSRLEVKAEVQGGDAAGLKQAARAEFLEPGGRWPLRVKRVSPALNKSTRLVEARLTFSGHTAAAGASGQLLWRAPEVHIPAAFVVRRAAGLGVYVAEGKDARFHLLPEAQEGRPAQAAGLKLESRIVTRGLGELRP